MFACYNNMTEFGINDKEYVKIRLYIYLYRRQVLTILLFKSNLDV